MMTSRSVRRWLACFLCAAVTMTSLHAIAQTTKAPAKKTIPSGVQPASGTSQPKTGGNPPGTSNGAATQPRQRPAAESLRIPEPSPEVMEILRTWEATTKKYQRLEGSFRKFTYDATYLIERRAVGEFYYEAPDKGAYQLKGDPDPKIAKGLVTKDKPVNGVKKDFTVQADRPDRWLCTGKEVFQIDDARKEYAMSFVPKEQQGEGIMQTPLPFLLGMKADMAKKRWEFKLLKRTESEIWLSARPLQQQDASVYTMATIVLDPQMFLPTAVRMFDPGGAVETVHLFGNVKINKNPANWLGQSPLEPRLKGYKMAQNPDAPTTGQAGSPGSKSAPRTGSGTNSTAQPKSTATKPGAKTATK